MMHLLHYRIRSFWTIIWLLALILPSAPLLIRPALAATTITVELEAVGDARIQGGSPTTNFGSGFLHLITLNGHYVLLQFDLSILPANATIDSAELQLNVTGVNTGPNTIEVGRNDDPWDEATLTWNNQPAITWGGPATLVNDAGSASWDVTALVAAWQNGNAPNYGFALRGDGGQQVTADSKETGVAPKLIVTYVFPDDEGPRPDLGDAPDSSNSIGVNPNTAYPGVPGNFPTVWNGTPAGQPAGPRHANQTGAGILGQYLSREVEADSGNDQDGAHNILDGGADNTDNDRGDDGWRNRQASFDHCTQTTLTVRVSKAPGATLDRMFLNVWFDGNRDGDWADRTTCTPEDAALAIPATEWIVQDYFVDMTGIPAGGYVDINVTTETILNTTPEARHWMRFTLSEARAVQTANDRADGRGPHPSVGSYQFGETEDVLQQPQPPGEDGELVLEKRVITSEDPVDYAGIVTYEIRLRHTGGTQPVQAEIRDELPYPLHLLPRIVNGQIEYVTVESSTGGAAPLQAMVEYNPSGPRPRQVVTWRGTLAPNAEVALSFDVHVHPLCEVNQQTVPLDNVAQARPRDGSEITAEASFTAACPGYDAGLIVVEDKEIIPLDDGIDLNDIRLRANVRNAHPIPVTLQISGWLTDTLSLYSPIASPTAERIALEPGETRPVEFTLRLRDTAEDELNLPADITLNGTLDYCILPGENVTQCIDDAQYPHLHRQSHPISVTVRPRDLGDAPDSTNHPAAAMTAYPGVQANFPTVFDPATGLPAGPMHAHPRPFHLGQQVSREAEADVGPDEDPTNNILPAANVPNQDRFDDGINPQQWSLTHCQATTVPVRVFISPQTVNWFQQQEQQGYLNIWLDGNRDGDWEDGGTCPDGQDVVEHIVIDEPVDVVGLGAGLHTLSVPTGLVPWPAQHAENPAWVRVTLGERESNKTLQSGNIKYGDGRGYDTPFQTGETEDYLAYPEGTAGGGPDMDVQVNGRVGHAGRLVFKIDYANLGARPADAARLIFQKPEQLRDMEIILLHAPSIPAQSIIETGENVTIDLPNVPAGASGTVVIGWDLKERAAAIRLAAGESYTARARITQDGDTDPSNNEAEVSVEAPAGTPIIAAVVADGAAWGLRETTCRNQINLTGRAEPGVPYDLMLDGDILASVSTDADGTFTYLLQNLSDGRHGVRLEAAQSSQTLFLDVATSLPIDPLSLVFTDSQGHTIHPPTLGWPLDTSNVGVALRDGETYAVGIDRCGDDPNAQIDLSLAGTTVSLRDDDGDGRYTGSFTYEPVERAALAAEAELSFNVTTGGATLRFATPLTTLTPGTVSDAGTGAPIADAGVTALDGTTLTAWPEVALGQPNPQRTDADGTYSFIIPGSENRLNVTSSGYQPYQSDTIVAVGGVLNQDIALMPEITGAATHTIYITESGFTPAVLIVSPGSVIEWVNVDLAEHSATGAASDSGMLEAGESYRVRLDSAGTLTYQDSTNPRNTATIIVGSSGAAADGRVFLPLIAR